jgi:hypothetical protein
MGHLLNINTFNINTFNINTFLYKNRRMLIDIYKFFFDIYISVLQLLLEK